MNLGDIARRNARLYPDKPAFVMGDRQISFAEYNRRLNRLVHALRQRGLGPSDRIAFLSRNSLELLDVLGAGEKGGFQVAPLNFRLSVGELARVLEKIDPHVLFAQAQYGKTVEEVGELLGRDERLSQGGRGRALRPPGRPRGGGDRSAR